MQQGSWMMQQFVVLDDAAGVLDDAAVCDGILWLIRVPCSYEVNGSHHMDHHI